MNTLHLGFSKHIELPKRRFLFIHDELPDITVYPHATVFDPNQHSLNPLKGITYKKARALADVLYSLTLQGETTLTVRNGKRALLTALLDARRFDKIMSRNEEVTAMIDDLLVSPVLRKVFCTPTSFAFNTTSEIFARINRKELGDFDALVLGLILINHYQGTVVIPDFGFYGRDAHTSLIREGRLIAGLNFLDELTPKLRRAVLLIPDKQARGALYDDAVTLAKFDGTYTPGQHGYHDIVTDAMKHD